MTHRFLICLAVVAAFVGCDRDPRTRAEAVPPGETPRSETTKHFAGLTLGESSVADAESWFGESADAPSSKTGFAARSWATVDGIPGGKLEMHFDEQGKLRLIASTVKSVPEASAPAFDRLLGAQSERRSMFTHDGKVSHTWKWTKDDATFWLMSTPAKPRDETLTTFAGFLRTDLDALGEEELQSYGGMDSVFEMMPARGGLMAGEPFVVGSLRGSLTIPRFQPEFGTGDDSRRAPDGMLFLLTAMRVQNEGEETVPDPMPGWRLLGPDGDEIPRAIDESEAFSRAMKELNPDAVVTAHEGLAPGAAAAMGAVYVVDAAVMRNPAGLSFEFRPSASGPGPTMPFGFVPHDFEPAP